MNIAEIRNSVVGSENCQAVGSHALEWITNYNSESVNSATVLSYIKKYNRKFSQNLRRIKIHEYTDYTF